jgi:hypothetical protein
MAFWSGGPAPGGAGGFSDETARIGDDAQPDAITKAAGVTCQHLTLFDGIRPGRRARR